MQGQKPKATSTPDMLAAALEYARKGWPVFPLHEPVGGGCSCRTPNCDDIGKHPRTEHGKNDATTDEKLIHSWWTKWPNANIGLWCRDFVVVDVDPQHGGDISMEGLFATKADRHGFETLEANTGGGGKHYVFKAPGFPVSSSAIARGVDIKAEGGYIVVEPSLHRSGRRYQWVDIDQAPQAIPAWLLAELKAKSAVGRPLEIPDVIPEGLRNATLHKLACSLRTSRHIKPDEIFDAVWAKNMRACVRPLDESEVRALVASACKHPAGRSAAYETKVSGVDEANSGRPTPELPLGLSKVDPADVNAVSTVPWPEPLGEFAYHGVLGDLLRAIEPHTEADIAAVLVQAIVMIGNICGRSAYFIVEGTNHYCNEFACIVGATAKGRKGSSFGQVRRVLRPVDAEWDKNRIKTGLSSGEGLIFHCRDEVKEMVKRKGIKALEVTDAGEKDKRLLVVEEELSSAIKTMSRDGNTLSGVLRQAWDSPQNLSPMTKTSRICASNPHISVIGHITRDELLKSLKLVENTNGFSNRFLWACAKRSKSLPFGGNSDTAVLAEISNRIDCAVGWIQQNPSRIDFDSEAAEIWAIAYEDLGRVPPGQVGGVVSRGEAHVRRIATVYAVLDQSPLLRAEHLLAALEVWRYSRQSVEWIFSSLTADDLGSRIESVVRNAGAEGVTKSQIHVSFNRKIKGQDLETHLRELLHAGRIHQRYEQRGRQSVNVFYAPDAGV